MLDENDAVLSTTDAFAERAAAEEWLGDTWADLLAQGGEQVVLIQGDREIYRMGLRAS